MLITLIPKSRLWLRQQSSKNFREILSSVSGDVFGNGRNAKIIKVKTHNGLFIEIYELKDTNPPRLHQQIKLRDRRDGHFLFNGESSNLVLDDINGDQVMEILAPSFDNNFTAHLNVFTYSPEQQRFIEMN